MSIFNDERDDEIIPEYDNPLGRLPNGNKLPADDQPDGTFVTFAESLFSQDERNDMSLAMMGHALKESQAKSATVPASIYKAFMKEAEDAQKAIARFNLDKSSKHYAENVAFMKARRKFFVSAASDFAVDVAIAVNAILANLVEQAQTSSPEYAAILARDVSKWKIGWVEPEPGAEDDE